MSKLSLKDIAQHFSISVATVSYILNGKSAEKRVSAQLTEKVMKFVKANDYKPNMLARGLRTGKTHIICLMVEDIADHFFSAVAGHIETLAHAKGYRMISCSTKNNASRTSDLISAFEQQNVDGFIIVPPSGIEDDINMLTKSATPFVLFDRYCPGIDASYVGMDNFESSVNATTHLLQQGYSNVAFVTLDSQQSQMQERRNGYESALKTYAKQPIVKSFSHSFTEPLDIADEMMEFINGHPHMDAIFFATNYLAAQGLRALSKMNRKIPAEMGVLAFDDSELFQVYRPTITAVSQPIHDMCVMLMDTLMGKIDDKQATPKSIILPALLSVRESSVKQIIA
jgi:LacI family transcriptional regulator